MISDVFDLYVGSDLNGEFSEIPPFEPFKHSACVTFKSAHTSIVNDEADVICDKLRQNWDRSCSNWKLTMSLSLILTQKTEPARPLPYVSDPFNPYKRMRTDEIFTDLTIIAGDGTQHKCHRAVLACQSPYFARVLDSGTEEARSGTAVLPHMNAEVVGAMFDYFYTWNIDVVEGNSFVCVELLKAGHLYDIETLQKCTKKILLDKTINWYTPEAALRLLLFIKDMDMTDLRLKAVNVCKK